MRHHNPAREPMTAPTVFQPAMHNHFDSASVITTNHSLYPNAAALQAMQAELVIAQTMMASLQTKLDAANSMMLSMMQNLMWTVQEMKCSDNEDLTPVVVSLKRWTTNGSKSCSLQIYISVTPTALTHF